MSKLSKYLLTRFTWKKDSTDSYYDSQGKIDTKALAISMKISEIVLKWATSSKFFDSGKNTLLHDSMLILIEFGNRLTKFRKDSKFEKIITLLCNILSCLTDYSITNGGTPPFLENIKKSSIASVILNNLLAKPETPPQLNLEALGCLANFSQYPEFLDKKELHECDVINRALVVYYAYKDYVEIPNFMFFLIAILHHFAQNPAFHHYLAKRQFNLLPLLVETASQTQASSPEVPEGEKSEQSEAKEEKPINTIDDLNKMLDVYEHLTKSAPKSIKHKELLDTICKIIKERKNINAKHIEQGLSCICNLAANKQVTEEESSVYSPGLVSSTTWYCQRHGCAHSP